MDGSDMQRWHATVVGLVLILGLLASAIHYVPGAEASAPTITLYGATPTRADGGGSFLFWLTYTSDENNAPTYVRVTKTLPAPSSTKDMNANDTGDTTYTDGKQYYYNWWYFDTIATSILFVLKVKDAIYAEVSKTMILKAFPFPRLTNECTHQNPGNWSFSVTYSSTMNVGPSKVQLKLDGVFHDMVENDTGDTTYLGGKDYHFNTTELLTEGNHTYQFYATDIYGSQSNVTSGLHLLIVTNRLNADTVQIHFSAFALLIMLGAVAGAGMVMFLRRS